MRIALIIERMDPSRGGRETSTAQIAAELAHRGHAVTILCQDHRAEIDKVDIRVIPTRGMSRAARLRHFVHEVQIKLTHDAFDVSHAMLPIPGATVYQPRGGTRPGVLAARHRMGRGLGAAMAKLGYSLNELRRLLAALEREVVESNTLLLPNSNMVAEEIAHHYGRTEGVIVIPNGLAIPDVSEEQQNQWRNEKREQLGASPEETIFLTVAKNYRLKGVDWAVKAFAQAFGESGSNPARLVCVGQGDAPQIQRLAGKLGVAGRVSTQPATEEIFRWYAVADVCVLLSWYDAASRVVLEATSWGIPSITTTYNGAAEVLADGAGIVVERPDSLNDVAGAMQSLTDPSERQRRSAACLAVAQNLSIEHHVDGLLQAYRSAE